MDKLFSGLITRQKLKQLKDTRILPTPKISRIITDYCTHCNKELFQGETVRVLPNSDQRKTNFIYHIGCPPDKPIKKLQMLFKEYDKNE